MTKLTVHEMVSCFWVYFKHKGIGCQPQEKIYCEMLYDCLSVGQWRTLELRDICIQIEFFADHGTASYPNQRQVIKLLYLFIRVEMS